MFVTPSTVSRALLALLSIIAGLHAQSVSAARLVLRVDEISGGPFAGQKSASCLRVYSNSQVVYAQWSNSAAAIVDKATGLASRPEHTSAFTAQLDDGDLQELSSLLESKATRRLSQEYGPPDKPVDYFESVIVDILGLRGVVKKVSTREYYVASLEEKNAISRRLNPAHGSYQANRENGNELW